ncbi:MULTISPECIES: glyceraldehyde-3-phosphate dehydrogenase [Alteromonadaceae]|jgi:glyceraldehyde 3-phosphate dehydrogenase|uniref:Glyceraldehyde-3-phosphate dehydrogenase n=1 Tax=Brumicola blandensis TaxID=3075611 RepID=A0AAW8QYE5_9ALTE|nr:MULTISPECIES: glyceraldehyde-3-phosphate dehydrogenase [unclassified Alteromonas]MDT0581799.1 glyceraldehyde-3-phosphate dehydrogenase [Alteromonas sp. W409]MDT0629850.1 glyceraldehyde-3-phosphate dehydrogenase [Alteromonas sp. W364]
MNQQFEQELLTSWQERQEYAEKMLPIIGKLYRNHCVEITVYGRTLLNASAIDVIKAHRTVRRHEGVKLRLRESWPVLEAISNMDLAPVEIDIGKLAFDFHYGKGKDQTDLQSYLDEALKAVHNAEDEHKATDVVLYGFGRIGRLLARLLIERQGKNNKLRLRAIVVRGGREGDLEKRASLLRRDSVHGPFNGSITVDEERKAIKANGSYIQVIYANSPEEVDYTQYGINNAIIIDNTGMWRDEEGLGLHLKAKGASKVLLTAPGKGDIKNIVHGVNHADILDTDNILSAASCTTNAITPVLKALDEEYGIENGHVETVHSFTNDQNLIDNYHKADRRGRSASLNMVITETGAAKAVAKAYPQLAGKLTGNAIRVPTPNVSMAILSLNLKSTTDKDSLNDYLQTASLFSDLQHQIDFTASTEIVSTDLVGTRAASVVDSQATIVAENRATLYVWYDNEFGYSCQVMRVVRDMAGLKYPLVPSAEPLTNS